MLKFLYNIAAHIALPLFGLFALFNGKARKNLGERLFPEPLGKGPEDLLWIHAASLGEAVIAQNLVEQIGIQVTQARFVVTTNTYYARDLLRSKIGEHITVRSFPLDLPFSINRFMDGSTFRGLILIETEIWPNLIWKAHQRGIPVLIVNGRISDGTIRRYRTLSPFLKHVFSCVRLVLAQSQHHAQRFVQLGMDPSRVTTIGNLKYFRNISPSLHHERGRGVVTFGSIKEKEVEPIISVAMELKKQFPRLLLFIVPRELHLVSSIEGALHNHLRTMRYSALKTAHSPPYDSLDAVVVDTVGDLLDLYGKSDVAFVGGSLAPYGGQNLLEPLFFETPVLFGPYVDNFREVAEEIKRVGGGVLVNNEYDLLQEIVLLMNNEQARTRMGKAGRGIIDAQNRVMSETVSRVREVLWKINSLPS